MSIYIRKILYFVLILVALGLLYFGGSILIHKFLDKNTNSDTSPEMVFYPFPSSRANYNLAPSEQLWQLSIFQGFVNGYGSENGLNYVKISYIKPNTEDLITVNVPLYYLQV
jgi:hypothetical protein